MKSEKSKDGGAQKRQPLADKGQQKGHEAGKDMQSKTPKSKNYLEDDEDDQPRSSRDTEDSYDDDSAEDRDSGQSGRERTKSPESGKPGKK